jgi:hypothetical protein
MGPAEFQATNVDLEIRAGEFAYTLVTADEALADYLCAVMEGVNVEDGGARR